MGVVATAVGVAEIAQIGIAMVSDLIATLETAHAAQAAGDQAKLNALYAAMKDIAQAVEQLPGK